MYFDVLLTHNRYTLLDRSAGTLIDEAGKCGTAVVNAGVFGGGILAKGPKAIPRYEYRPALSQVLQAAERIEACCLSYGVPLGAAALQFSTKDLRVTSTVVGISRPERIDETVALLETSVPLELWEELELLVPERQFWLDPEG